MNFVQLIPLLILMITKGGGSFGTKCLSIVTGFWKNFFLLIEIIGIPGVSRAMNYSKEDGAP